MKKKNIIPIWKFIIYSIVTLGIYQLFWINKTWKLLKKENKLKVYIPTQTFASSINVAGLIDEIRQLNINNQIYKDIIIHPLLLIIYPIFLYSPLYLDLEFMWTNLILNMSSGFILIPVVKSMNRFWTKMYKEF